MPTTSQLSLATALTTSVTLSWFHVSMFAEMSNGSREFLEDAECCVLAHTEKEAQEYVFDKHFPGAYWNSGYATPSYEVEKVCDVVELHGAENMPALDDLCQWILDNWGAHQLEALGKMLIERGAGAESVGRLRELDGLCAAFSEASSSFGSQLAFYQALYEIKPLSAFFTVGSEDELCSINEELRFAVPVR